MPDLLTHFTSAYILKVPDRWKRFRVPFYLGVLLPDLLTRPLGILFPSTGYYIFTLHTPIMVVAVCLLIPQFFEKEIRSGIRLNLLLGITLHYALDLLQKRVVTAYYWFFPFSWKTFDLGLFWPDDPLRLAPLWIGLIVIIEAVLHIRRMKS